MAGGFIPVVGIAFLDEYLPKRGRVIDRWLEEASLRGSPAYEGEAGAVLGRVFDIAIAFDLATIAPFVDRLNFLQESDRALLLTAFGYQHEREAIWRKTGPSPANLTCDIARILVAIDAVSRFPDPREFLVAQWVDGVLPLVAGGLDAAWVTYRSHGRRPLADLGEMRGCQVEFFDGALRADVILGSTIVEVKLVQDIVSAARCGMDEVLMYALADTNDDLSLEQVGIYLGWYGVLFGASLAELLCASGSGPHDLKSLRSAFFSTTSEARREYAKWVARRTN